MTKKIVCNYRSVTEKVKKRINSRSAYIDVRHNDRHKHFHLVF